MSRLILILSVLLLVGCKTSRKVVEEERKEWKVDSIASLQSSHKEDWNFDWVKSDSTWWKRVGKITVYDTERTDADGTHPVKVVIESVAEGGTIKNDSCAIAATTRDSISTYTETHNEGESEYKKKSDTRFGMGFSSNILVIAVALLLITFVIKVWKR